MSYYITFDSSGGVSLVHGVEWRRHKYIRKEGNRYIYPEDLKKSTYPDVERQYNQARRNASRENQKGYNRTVSYISKGISAENPDFSKKAVKNLTSAWVNAEGTSGPISGYYKELGRLQETSPKKVHATMAADKANWDGRRLTQKIFEEGGWNHHRGIEKRINYDLEAPRRQAQKAVDKYQNDGQKRTEAEVGRKVDHYNKTIATAQRRGMEKMNDMWNRDRGPNAMGMYNVSEKTPGAVQTHSYGERSYIKYETAKEHQARLNAGVAQRAAGVKFKASINTATKAVAKWGSNTINSAKNLASKGASLVSNLFKKKK